MPIIPIPFTKGQSEAVDSKLLPNGLFSSLVNCRYRKDGRLGTRFGYAFDATSGHPTPASVVFSAAFADRHLMSIEARPNYFAAAKGYRLVNGVYNFTANAPLNTDFAYAKRMRTFLTRRDGSNTGDQAMSSDQSFACSDAVLNGTLLATAASPYTVAVGGNLGEPSVFQVTADTGVNPPDTFGAILSTSSNHKVVVISGVTCVFWALQGSAQVLMRRLDTWATVVVVATTGGNRASYFDVSAGGSASEAYLVYQSGATTLTFGTVTVAGIFAALNTIAGTNADLRASIAPTFNAPTDDIVIVWNDGASFVTGTCKVTVYRRSTTTFTTATTTVENSGNCTGYPVVSGHLGDNWVAACGIALTTANTTFSTYIFRASTTFPNGGNYYFNVMPASKPFNTTTGNYIALVNRDLASDLNPCSYLLFDTFFGNGTASTIPYLFFNYSISRTNIEFCKDIARPADMSTKVADPRRKIVAVPSTGPDPGGTAFEGFFPVKQTGNAGMVLMRFEQSPRATIATTSLNGQLFMSGPRVLHYDGELVSPVGFPSVPTFIGPASLTAPLGGGLAAGTYQYTYLWEFVDKNGYVHQSAPALPLTVVCVDGTGTGVSVACGGPLWGGGTPASGAINFRLFRTLAGGTVFFELTPPVVISNAGFAGVVQLVGQDIFPDSAIRTHPILYTQGARGGLSGNLQNDAPPSARFIVGGSDRVLLGGMENPFQVQWSKLRFDGEPLAFSNTPAFRATIDKEITGVSEMDGIWFLGSLDTIWTVNGAGPDDSGAGTFSPPQRLPGDTGFLSHKSIVRAGIGILFQGITGRFYLIARGGSAAQEVGQVVRDTLVAFPYVSASTYNQKEQVAYWAVTDTAASAGRIVVYDTIRDLWSVDNFYGRAIKTLSIYDGKLVIDGSIIETATYTDDDTGAKADAILPVWVTGDIRAFGANGWGRYRKVQLLGEARDVTVAWSLTLDVSYDSGKTFAETATWTRANLALAIGDSIDGAEHAFVTQKTDTVRLRGSITTPSPTEGLVFNELSLDVRPEGGLKRQPNALRAP